MKKFKFILFSLASLLLLTLASIWGLRPSTIPAGEVAMAEYKLENLSCGSCVSKIKKTLSGLSGIGEVEVDLTSSRGRITFDPEQIDSTKIATTITTAGYPAKLRTELSPSELNALEQEREALGQQYVARIGDRLLARSDFEASVKQRAADSTGVQQAAFKRSVWNEVLQRELLLAAASEKGIVVLEGEIDQRMDEMKQQHAGFEKLIANRYPDRRAFRELLREDMIIQRNLDQNVFNGLTSQSQKQQRFQVWFADLQDSVEVVVFDPEIRALSANGSGCGGGCCG